MGPEGVVVVGVEDVGWLVVVELVVGPGLVVGPVLLPSPIVVVIGPFST